MIVMKFPNIIKKSFAFVKFLAKLELKKKKMNNFHEFFDINVKNFNL